ncbi:hypothetical protein CLAFUW4_11714 [Fulvia fulva]|uniref:Cyclochlorotine biosynthesis protein O n=1 Tax=Passalora fulva TaxID=5499 RepID=A0A9Q8PC91_PASFU|nr:uncharacterized protein CLAFUR5_10759 [Fulvia fulva]KAK4619575.1 hypothetical protein CLAFUR4_11719 [Fulvia fulva]KAK4620757.1 hypothetical protein CLAFUR0_11732 [Fulvia fulva]UJO19798.1 hypothetical protein CLAFUR5_10759 [Fulvia fulva]WPV17022.1 hypothetical protein CLAFUW4_11714 [Fulvia fulva]WPV32584.1 hypothetical protein CLAFUW7_11722 [Fulvia fulva]
MSYTDNGFHGQQRGEYDLLSNAERPMSAKKGLSMRWILVALLTTNMISILLTNSYTRRQDIDALSPDLKGTEAVYDGVDREMSIKAFDPFDPYDNESIYTATPSQDVERAWRELGAEVGSWLLPKQYGHIYDLDISRYMYQDKDFAPGGAEGYLVQSWATHDLHCVNLLRKNLYYNHEHYAGRMSHELQENEWFNKAHINHCVNALRQRVMCTADSGVIPFAWKGPGENDHKPDFRSPHKCHDYESLHRWMTQQEAKVHRGPTGIPVPPGSTFDGAGFRWAGPLYNHDSQSHR